MKKCAFYTFVSDNYYEPIGTPKLISSFKKFHSDIDLWIFRQDMVDVIFKKYPINWLVAKPFFAKLLVKDYELVVNIDADSVVLGRLDEVLADNYDIGSVTNFNDYENRKVENITEKMFIQAGLVASRKPEFWDLWIEWNQQAWKYQCAENDTLNLMWYNDKRLKDWKKIIFDKDKNYLGCKSLGREKEFYLEDNKVMCRKEQVKIYHHAKGPAALPKLIYKNLGFPEDVVKYLNFISEYGTTERYGKL